MKSFVSLLLICTILGTAPARSQSITLEELTDPDGMTVATLSPDGRHIAAIIYDGRAHSLILIDTDTLVARNVLGGFSAFDRAPLNVTWAGNDLLAVDYARDAESIDLRGKKLHRLGHSIIGRVGDGGDAGKLLVRKNAIPGQLARCDARTAKCTTFELPPGKPIARAFDRNGNLRAVTLLDSGFLEDVSTVSNWYKPLNQDTWIKLTESGINDEYWTPVYVPDDPNALVINSRIDRDTYALFKYDIAARRQVDLMAGHPTEDIVSWDGVDKTAFDYVATGGMLPQQIWFDPAWAAQQHSIDAALPNRLNFISGDPNRSLLVRSHGDVDPGTWYLLDVKKRTLVTVGKVKPKLDPAKMRPMEVMSYKAADGISIPAYLTRPAQSKGPAPTVVLIHGGPVSRDRWEWNAEVQLLANRGYLVFQPQFRGSSGFGRKFEVAGYGQWGRAMQDDITDGVRHLISAGIADPGRICIVGASYGGYAALWGAVKTPELYRCAVSFAGVTDIAYMYSDWSDSSFDKLTREIMMHRIGNKKMRAQLFDPVSPLKHAAQIKAPVLLMHGKDDFRVPISHGKKMRDALEAHGKTVTWLTFDEEGHGLTYVKNQILYYRTMLEFLAKHIPVQPAADTADAAQAQASPSAAATP